MRLSMIKRMVKVWTLSRVVLYHSFAPRGMNVSWLLHHLFLQSALCIILSSTNGQKKGQKSQIYCFASARDCRRWTIIPSLLAISNPFNFPFNIISCNSHFFQFPIKDMWTHILLAQKSNCNYTHNNHKTESFREVIVCLIICIDLPVCTKKNTVRAYIYNVIAWNQAIWVGKFFSKG